MKFSGEDIRNQRFENRMRGYDTHQVQEYLGVVAREFEELVRVNKELKGRVDELHSEVMDYRRRERGLVESLELTRQVSEDVRHQAMRDAELTVAEAEMKAEKILSQVELEKARLEGELLELSSRRIRFEARLRALIEGQLRILDEFSEDGEQDGWELVSSTEM